MPQVQPNSAERVGVQQGMDEMSRSQVEVEVEFEVDLRR